VRCHGVDRQALGIVDCFVTPFKIAPLLKRIQQTLASTPSEAAS
jgi:hypothetical protein